MHFNVDNLVGEQYDDPVAPCVRYSMCRILMYNGIDNEGMECLPPPVDQAKEWEPLLAGLVKEFKK